jgi:hypothetical protein
MEIESRTWLLRVAEKKVARDEPALLYLSDQVPSMA